MKTLLAIGALVMLGSTVLADSHHVEADGKTDFSMIKTFVIREGHATSRNAEINNKLTLKTIEDAIRTGLQSKGMKEVPDRADLVVTFSLAEQGQRDVIGRGIRNMRVVQNSAGTLVIEMTTSGRAALVWQGIYEDSESNAAKLAKRLPDDAKKLISEYPAKKK